MFLFRKSFVSVAILALATPSASWALSSVSTDSVVEHEADDSLAVWSDVAPGRRSLPTLTINDSIYPNDSGVQFLVDGHSDDRNPRAVRMVSTRPARRTNRPSTCIRAWNRWTDRLSRPAGRIGTAMPTSVFTWWEPTCRRTLHFRRRDW